MRRETGLQETEMRFQQSRLNLKSAGLHSSRSCMNQPSQRRFKFATRQGLVAAGLTFLAGLCFASNLIHTSDYQSLMGVIALVLSFPIGLGFMILTGSLLYDGGAYHDALSPFAILSAGVIGTLLNIRAWLWLGRILFFRTDTERPPEVREAEFQQLLAEHRRHNG